MIIVYWVWLWPNWATPSHAVWLIETFKNNKNSRAFIDWYIWCSCSQWCFVFVWAGSLEMSWISIFVLTCSFCSCSVSTGRLCSHEASLGNHMITFCSSSFNELHQFSRILSHHLSQCSWRFESESTVCSLKAETILVSNYFQTLFNSVAGYVVLFERHTRVLRKYHSDLCNMATGAVAL